MLADIYHACHRELVAAEADYPFAIQNFMSLIGEAMGMSRADLYKRMVLYRDLEQIMREAEPYLGGPWGPTRRWCSCNCRARCGVVRPRRPSRSATRARTARDEFAPVRHSVGQRVVAANEEAGGAEIIVGGQGFCDRLGRAHQGCGVAAGASDGGEGGPQATIVHIFFRSGVEQPH